MAYTSYSDLPYVMQADKLAAWGVPTSPTSARDADILKHATRAQSVIDAKLASRFVGRLPFATTPPIIAQISLDLTIYFMASAQQVVGDSYLRNYEAAIKLLDEIAAGNVPVYLANSTNLDEFDDTYGFDSNADFSHDEDEDTYRVFPRSLLGEPPSTDVRTYRDEE